MANFRRKRPKKVLGPGCWMCTHDKRMGNSNVWGTWFHQPYAAKQRKDRDRLEREQGWR